jgi:hypothetical protein
MSFTTTDASHAIPIAIIEVAIEDIAKMSILKLAGYA